MEPLVIVGAILTLGLVYVAFPVALHTYRRIRGRKFVICPETDRSAEIEIGAVRAGVGAAAGTQWLQVNRCGRWPEHEACDRSCLEGVNSELAESDWLLLPDRAAQRSRS